ncbi:MAG: hypothetical protein ACK564_06730 [Novosphingobium sp.]|jgi:hypothetical protein|uniref:hypothetical protein n=1 Tax=Novosphingobium sp. TaxID=1874826 RepID=UPI00391B5D4C|nr:hypothetical protein [Novosphingobium sp.]
MKASLVASAVALSVIAVSAPSLADDPKDPLLSKSAEARARDKAIIRQLNINEMQRVRAQEAQQAQGWQAYREQPARQAEYRAALADHAREQAAYEQKMAAWREAVRRCRAGEFSYCDN